MGEKHKVSDRKYRDHRRRTRAARAASLQPSQGSWIRFKTFRLSRYVCKASGSAQMCQTLTPAGLPHLGAATVARVRVRVGSADAAIR